MCAFFWY
jgi:hypothetical protein